MDSIVSPPRIDTLNPQPIRVIVHTEPKEEFTLPNVFPFMTLYNLKQRIIVHKEGAREWRNVFLAQEAANGEFKPLEFKIGRAHV